jgi:hypothetical protein
LADSDIAGILKAVFDSDTGSLRISDQGGGGGGGTGGADVQNDDVEIVEAADTLDFSADFDVTESPAGEANIAISSDIARTSDVTSAVSAHDADTAVHGIADTSILETTTGSQAKVDLHTADAIDAHAASAISIVDAAGDFTATDVEGALAELQADAETDDAALATHIADGTAAHAASAIGFTPAGTIANSDVQAAVEEVATDAASALSTHAGDTSSVHGLTDTTLTEALTLAEVSTQLGAVGSGLNKMMYYAATTGTATSATLGTIAAEAETAYARYAGRTGGTTLYGGTAAGDDLTLQATSNSATSGDVNIAGSLINVDALSMTFDALGFTFTGAMTVAGNLALSGRNIHTETVATITAVSDTIPITNPTVRLDNTSGSSKTLTSAPTVATGSNNQRLFIYNGSAQDVVLQDQGTLASSNLRLTTTTVTLSTRDSIELMYSTTIGDWIEIGRSNVL